MSLLGGLGTLALGLLLALPAEAAPPETRWAVQSPSGALTFALRLDPGPGRGTLTYSVSRLSGGVATAVVQASPLGVRLSTASFDSGLRFVSAGPVALVDEIYAPLHGKTSSVRHPARQQTFTFAKGPAAHVELVVRVADDGAAFRYAFPGKGAEVVTLLDEATGFQLPPGSLAWMMPQDPPTRYTPAYENFFSEMAAGTTAPTPSGWDFPALFEVDGGKSWLLVSESGVDASNAGSRLAAEAPGRLYRIRLPEAGEGGGVGAAEPSSSLPWTLPWRVLIVGTLADIAESTLVDDLAPPSVVTDTSWIRPGRASWSWWSDDDSPRSEFKLNAFVDLAADMGWEYSLVDANWNTLPPGALERVLAHAREKKVGVLLWYNSGGPHNDVPEQPRDRMHIAETRRTELSRLHDLGVAGIKVDFWQSDKQDRIQQYLDLLRDAAEFHLLVDFHGCTLPRGWSRTYPHLMSMEAVMGAEQYKLRETYPGRAAAHNTMLAFTRNVVGPMDFTPVTFTDLKYPRVTTDAHELALSVVFDCDVGIGQHCCPNLWPTARGPAGGPGRRRGGPP